VCQRPVRSKTNTINTFIVTLSLPSRSPHHYRLHRLTARALGANLTGSRQRLEVGHCHLCFQSRYIALSYPVMENRHASPSGKVTSGSSSEVQALPARLFTVDEIIAELGFFTVEQRSLAWSPEPPFARVGAHDCRMGGSCGLDFNRDTAHARWVQARHRWNREQKKLQDTPHSRG
jgi:hypothetical protein